MGRIADAFDNARRENRAALVIYLCAGDPDLGSTEDLVVAALNVALKKAKELQAEAQQGQLGNMMGGMGGMPGLGGMDLGSLLGGLGNGRTSQQHGQQQRGDGRQDTCSEHGAGGLP